MNECLGRTNPACGLAALERAAKDGALLIDYDPAKEGMRIAVREDASALEGVVRAQSVNALGASDVAIFGCLACGRRMVFEDDGGDYLVDGQTMSTY